MSLRNRMYELIAVEDVDEFLEKYPTGAFFKAGGCHKTMQGFGYVEQALDKRENIYLGFVRVIEHRPVSNYIAEIMNIVHQSPQLILYVNKKPVYDVDNWNINVQDVDAALVRHFGSLTVTNSLSKNVQANGDIKVYTKLLNQLLNGELSEEEFENSWLMTFQMDASPRTTDEFNLLNSLFGDVDKAIVNNTLRPQVSDQPLIYQKSILKDKAAILLKQLELHVH